MEADKPIRKNKLRAYRKQLNSEKFMLENELLFSEENDAIIECKIGKIENLFSPYDIAKNRTINETFAEYLLQETEIVPIKHNLNLRLFVNPETTTEQEEQIKKAIRRHFSFIITSSNEKLKRTNFLSWFLYSLGTMLLFLNFYMGLFDYLAPLRDTTLIITWFLIWEATSIAFFDRRKLRRKIYNMLRIYNANVSFNKDLVIN